jgi:hypothetical protein
MRVHVKEAGHHHVTTAVDGGVGSAPEAGVDVQDSAAAS